MGLRRDLLLFPGGKKYAFTLSYDDAVTQDVRLLEMMNRYGVKGTFNINTGLLGQKSFHTQNGKEVTHHKLQYSQILDVYKGQEIAVHGLTHLDLALAGGATASYEVSADRKNIEDLLKKPVRGMAYPFGTYSDKLVELLRLSGMEYARTTKSTHSFELPEDFLLWHPTCHHADETLFDLSERFFAAAPKYYGPRLFYVWGHSYEFDVRDDWDRMERFLELMAGKNFVWYATNGEICDYVNAAKGLRYSSTGQYIENPSAKDVWLCLDGETVLLPAGQIKELHKPD